MDPEITVTEAAATPAPPPVPAAEVQSEPKPVELAEFVRLKYAEAQATLAAKESEQVHPVTTEAKAAAVTAETVETKPEPVAEVPFTPEQLADPKHWDRLDKPGWERAAKLHPVETARVKAGYAAASRIVEEARNRASSQPRPEPEKKEEPKADPYAEALALADSLDPSERSKGFRAMARLEAEQLLRERDAATGFDPVQAQARAAEESAYRAAAAEMPELNELPNADLNAAVEGDQDLLDDVSIAVTLEGEARVRLLAKVMKRAGRIVLDKRAATKAAERAEAARKAKEVKDEEVQKRLRSNKDNASTVVAETPGGKTPKGDETIEETIRRKVAALR